MSSDADDSHILELPTPAAASCASASFAAFAVGSSVELYGKAALAHGEPKARLTLDEVGHRYPVTSLAATSSGEEDGLELLCSASKDCCLVHEITRQRLFRPSSDVDEKSADFAAGGDNDHVLELRQTIEVSSGRDAGGDVECVAFDASACLVAICVGKAVDVRVIYSATGEEEGVGNGGDGYGEDGYGNCVGSANLFVRLEGHRGRVMACAFNPAVAQQLVTVSEDRTFRIWDRELCRPPLYGTLVCSLTFPGHRCLRYSRFSSPVEDRALVMESAVLCSSPLVSIAVHWGGGRGGDGDQDADEEGYGAAFAAGASDGKVRFFSLDRATLGQCLATVDVAAFVSRQRRQRLSLGVAGAGGGSPLIATTTSAAATAAGGASGNAGRKAVLPGWARGTPEAKGGGSKSSSSKVVSSATQQHQRRRQSWLGAERKESERERAPDVGCAILGMAYLYSVGEGGEAGAMEQWWQTPRGAASAALAEERKASRFTPLLVATPSFVVVVNTRTYLPVAAAVNLDLLPHPGLITAMSVYRGGSRGESNGGGGTTNHDFETKFEEDSAGDKPLLLASSAFHAQVFVKPLRLAGVASQDGEIRKEECKLRGEKEERGKAKASQLTFGPAQGLDIGSVLSEIEDEAMRHALAIEQQQEQHQRRQQHKTNRVVSVPALSVVPSRELESESPIGRGLRLSEDTLQTREERERGKRRRRAREKKRSQGGAGSARDKPVTFHSRISSSGYGAAVPWSVRKREKGRAARGRGRERSRSKSRRSGANA